MRHPNRSPLLLVALMMLGTTTVPAGAKEQAPKSKPQPRPSPATSPPEGDEQTDPYAKRFQELDANRDGFVSLDEWPLEEVKFRVVDRNQDGRLSQTELLTPNVLRRAPWEKRFRDLDRNKDGRLNRSEAPLDRRDRNRDGYVSLSEYRGGLQDVWQPNATLQDRRRFQSLDRNLDNRLSRVELGSAAVFENLDRNKDGVLSPNEWP